jgi:hypothetical protein
MHTLHSELHRNVLDLFNEDGVQIMTPAYEGDWPSRRSFAERTGTRRRPSGNPLTGS